MNVVIHSQGMGSQLLGFWVAAARKYGINIHGESGSAHSAFQLNISAMWPGFLQYTARYEARGKRARQKNKRRYEI